MQETDAIERQQLGWYMRNCAKSAAANKLEIALLERVKILNGTSTIDYEPLDIKDADQRTALLNEMAALLSTFKDPGQSNESLEQNTQFAREEFKLDEIETEILLLLLRYERNHYVERLADNVRRNLGDTPTAISALIGKSRQDVHKRIKQQLGCGIFTIDHDASDFGGQGGFLQLSPPLRRTMFKPYSSREEWAADLFGAAALPKLDWTDYDHLAETRDLALAILSGSAKHDAKGINIIVYGPVGTGKTEFCKALAKKSGLDLWAVGEADDEGGEPTRLERLASLRLAQRLANGRQNVSILFDEAEDLLEQNSTGSAFGWNPYRRNGSKVHLNRVIEENPVPVLWTCNDIDSIEPAVLRRMTMAIEIRIPNSAVRERIWKRVLSENGVEVGNATTRRLALRYEAPPALTATAARAAALAGGGEREIGRTIEGLLQVLNVTSYPAGLGQDDFNFSLVNCNENLNVLTENLSRAGAQTNWSLCLHGEPGTGKSQFARHLAQRLGLDVIYKRASDLLSKWVGQSEKQIATAFSDARAQKAMLIFDEADSLLQDRRGAKHSWEVTQVNEMLTWMESHPLPFVCTTNLVDRLDPASLRRFSLKLRFDYLNDQQTTCAFEHFFGVGAPGPLPEGLTPGDFATVRRRRDIFGPTAPDLLIEWLEQEVESKGLRPAGIGFVPIIRSKRAS